MVGSRLKRALGFEVEVKDVQKGLDSDLRRLRRQKRTAFQKGLDADLRALRRKRKEKRRGK